MQGLNLKENKQISCLQNKGIQHHFSYMVLQFPQKNESGRNGLCIKKSISSENIHDIKRKIETNHPIKINADNDLAFLIENRFTKKQYNNIKALNKQQGYL